MKKSILFSIFFISFISIIIGQNTQANLLDKLSGLSSSQKKLKITLNSHFFNKVVEMEKNGDLPFIKRSLISYNDDLFKVDERNRVRVEIGVPKLDADYRINLEKFGFETKHEIPLFHKYEGMLPIQSIYKISNLPFISFIKTVEKPFINYTTDGDWFHQANGVRNQYLYTGAGRKVGIISDGADHWFEAHNNNELPGFIEFANLNFSSGDEGTAMLEIVHDLAPDASLAFGGVESASPADFVDIINELVQIGCNVICDDIIYPNEPVFEDGPISQAINQAYSNNVIYISSCGNYRESHYINDYLIGNNNFHQFSSINDYLEISNTSEPMTIVLQWNDQFGQSSNDYDLYLYDDQNNFITKSSDFQTGDDEPVEALQFDPSGRTSFTFRIKILNYQGNAAPRKLSIFIFSHAQCYPSIQSTESSTFGHSTALGSLSVGAIRLSFSQEDYSGEGPALIYSFDGNGNPVNHTERIKPDISALTCVQTYTSNCDWFYHPEGFCGTSASAPHVAGASALVWSANLAKSASDIRNALESGALDLPSNSLKNNQYGEGCLDALSATALILPQVTIANVQFDKTNYIPNEPATITVTLGNSLPSANVTFSYNTQTYYCTESGGGVYTRTFIVASTQGTYSVIVDASKTGYIDATPYHTSIILNDIKSLYNGNINPSQGNTSTNFQFSVYFKDLQAPQYIKASGSGWTLPMIGSGNYQNGVQFTGNKTFSSPGSYTYYFEAKTASGLILRYPETGFLTVNVSQSAVGWDLAVMSTGTFFSPSNVQPGTTITVTAAVKNQSTVGNTYVNVPLKVQLINSSGTTINENTFIIPSLTSGTTGNYNLSLTMPSNAPDGNYQILILVTPYLDNVPSNNSLSLGLYMGPSLGNDQFEIPSGSQEIQTGGTVNISGNTFTLWGINTTEDYATFKAPDGTLSKVYMDHLKYWSSYGAMISLEMVDGGPPAYAFIKAGHSSPSGPSFMNNLAVGNPSQTVTFEATAPTGKYFISSDTYDYPILVTGTTSSNPNVVKNWLASVQRTNGNTKVLLNFNIPSNATIKTYTFYIVTPYTSSPPEYMSRLQIQVDAPLPHITSLNTYSFSADDLITITGTNFGTTTGNVKFYNNLNGTVISWNNTQITCKVPNGVESGNVFVVNSAGTSNGILYQIISSTGDPIVIQPIPDQSMNQNSSLVVATLTNVFWDPNNDPLIFTPTSSSINVTTTIDNGILSVTSGGGFSGQALITVSATDLDNATVQDVFTITVIQNLPLPPSTLAATPISNNRIDLTWNNVINEDGYHLYRASEINGNFSLLATVGADITTYSDIGLSENTQYCYKVTAFNAGGNSGDSPISCATTLSIQLPPPAPTFINTTAVSENQINIQWDNVAGEDGYVLWTPQIGIIPMLWEVTLGPDVTSYSHTGLPSGTEVCYYVRAFNTDGSSADQGPSCATTFNVQNLDCSTAVPLICGIPYNGNTTGETSIVSTYNCSPWNESGPEKVHTITLGSSGPLVVQLGGLAVDIDVFILGNCDVNNCLAYGDNGASISNATPGIYYIVVDGYNGATGNYTLTASCPDFSANFTAVPTLLNPGQSVAFTDNSVGNPTSWLWTFEGGTPSTSTSQNPVITYNCSGTFDVSLTIGNGSNTNTLVKSGYINVQNNLSGGLVAYYPFNGNSNDESGNGNNGILSGPVLTSDRFGNPNAAYEFNGVNDYIDCGNGPTINISGQNSNVTMSCWFKPHNPGWQYLISKGRDYTTNYGYHTYINNDDMATGLFRLSSNVNCTPQHTNAIQPNLWYQVVTTYDGTYGKIYLNGELVDTDSVPGQIGPSSTNLILGCHSQSPPSWYVFDGVMDDVRIYNRTLCEGEIHALYNLSTTCPGTPTITDTRNGKTYNTVLIGSQCWMKENLNIGTRIQGSMDQTNNNSLEKYCIDNVEANCDIYGGLYQWNEMMQYTTTPSVQGICPTGWHIPSDAEWCSVTSFLDATLNCNTIGLSGTTAGGKMKEAGFNHWISPNTGATNESGFTGLGAGYRRNTNDFSTVGGSTYFWTSNECSTISAWYRGLGNDLASVQRYCDFYTKSGGFSVRCIKDTCQTLSNVNVSITPSANPVCSGTSVTFTATPTNGGANPVYQWKKGGVNISGATNVTYSYVPVNADAITCQLTSNATCTTGNPATSNTVTLTVNTNLPVSVSIAASANPVCSGTSVTFTATPTNGGANPTYQWKKGGVNISGATNITYSYTPVNADAITCQLTSNATCTTGNPATSNTVAMTVNTNLPVSVSIAASANPVCSGTSVTFTATPTNGGANPTYQWKKGGVNISGATNITYSYTPVNADAITCQLTSNATCTTGNPAISNTVTMTVNTRLPVSVSIAASANPVCSGTSVTFTATPTNGGANPAYQWKKGGVNISGATNVTYSYTPVNADAITCQLTSNATCTSGNPATSNTITMTVNTNLPVSVSIATSANPVCSGTSVTFTATPTNGGSNPAYQWKKGGVNISGATNITYSYIPVNADAITCQLTSNATCTTGNPATSNTLTMTVNTNLPVSVSIAASANPVCSGNSVTFTATPTNGGNNPAYQWKKGGVNISGATNVTYSYTPVNADAITCKLTSNAPCTSGNPATSNTVTMTVNTNQPVSVSIAASANPVCAGTSVTFTATPTNGGSNPSYQWRKGGANISGATNATYSYIPVNNDVITCRITSTLACATGNPATSNAVTMNVNLSLTPSVVITSSANPVCEGVSVTFMAIPINGGASPTYIWIVNGFEQSSDPTYSYTPANNDVITCIMTSSLSCATVNPVISNPLTMVVNPQDPVNVTIKVATPFQCGSDSATFIAYPSNAGTNPAYQWSKNGFLVTGATNSTFRTETSSRVDCQVTADDICSSVRSNYLAPGMYAIPNPVCYGQPISLFCGGLFGCGLSNATYKWSNSSGSWTYTAIGDNYVEPVINFGEDGYASDIFYLSIDFIPPPNGHSSGWVCVDISPELVILGMLTNASCTGMCDGVVNLNINGGTPPYNYLWSNGATTRNISGLCADTYSVTVIDSYLCQVEGNFDIGVDLLMAPSAGTHNPAPSQIVWNWNTVAGAIGYKWNTVNNYNSAIDVGTATTKAETGLTCNTSYSRYVWAYNVCGHSTATTLMQTTNSCPWECGQTFADTRDGRSYNTIQIGTQCWMKENLNIGTRINGSGNQTNNGTIEKYCYNNNEANCSIYGGLYQWSEMMQYSNTPGIQGICPPGWHIPSDGELCTITQFLDPTVSCSVNGWSGVNAGGKMKEAGYGHWFSPNTGATNESGFTALPDGRRTIAGTFTNLGLAANFWTSSEGSPTTSAWGRNIDFDNASIHRDMNDKGNGRNCRCIRTTTKPIVITASITNITPSTAASGGTVTSDGGAPVTARGVCWSSTPNPTIAGNHTTDGTGIGAFGSTITGLAPNTLYYVNTYATNSVGTAYGNEVSMKTLWGVCGTSTLTVNHATAGGVAPVNKTVTYGTVDNIPGEITKCWITRNLGANQQATSVNDATEASAGWYWQFNRKQGYKHDGSTRTPNTSWINNISETSDWISASDPCNLELGNGWRIPTYTEWNNVDAAGNWTNWNGSWGSGLKLHAAGFLDYTNGSVYLRGVFGNNWSSTQSIAATGFYINFKSDFSATWDGSKAYGFSLRCIRESANIPTSTTIIGLVNETSCYNAIQTLTVAGNGTAFMVPNGGNVTMIAGQKIKYLPTTTVSSGGYMHGYISTNGQFCGLQAPAIPAIVAGDEEQPAVINKPYFKVYPNPTTGNFILELSEYLSAETVRVDMFGIWGEKLSSVILSGERKHEFSLSDRPVGVYFIRVISGATTQTVKIIKQ